MEVLFFGQLTDITKTKKMVLDAPTDSEAVVKYLHEQFPALASATFVLAVNGQVVQHNTLLEPTATLALLPPFSGG